MLIGCGLQGIKWGGVGYKGRRTGIMTGSHGKNLHGIRRVGARSHILPIVPTAA